MFLPAMYQPSSTPSKGIPAMKNIAAPLSASEFALKRIEEDRDVAEACLAIANTPWFADNMFNNTVWYNDSDNKTRDLLGNDFNGAPVPAAITEYIAANDPAKTIRLCDYLELVVNNDVADTVNIPEDVDWLYAELTEVVVVRLEDGHVTYFLDDFLRAYSVPSSTLLAVCALWSTHPDYNSEWAV